MASGATLSVLGLGALLTTVLLCAMRGATTAERIEILVAAAPLGREWLRHPILSLRRLPNVSVNGPSSPADVGLPQDSENRKPKGCLSSSHSPGHHGSMTVSDWVPVVSSILSGVASGAIGVFATLRVSKRHQETATAVAQMQADAHKHAAREERTQRRFESACGDLLAWVAEMEERERQLLLSYLHLQVHLRTRNLDEDQELPFESQTREGPHPPWHIFQNAHLWPSELVEHVKDLESSVRIFGMMLILKWNHKSIIDQRFTVVPQGPTGFGVKLSVCSAEERADAEDRLRDNRPPLEVDKAYQQVANSINRVRNLVRTNYI